MQQRIAQIIALTEQSKQSHRTEQLKLSLIEQKPLIST
jgi:hypothetical protein